MSGGCQNFAAVTPPGMEFSIQLRITRKDEAQGLAYSLPGAMLFHLIRTTVIIPKERQSLIVLTASIFRLSALELTT